MGALRLQLQPGRSGGSASSLEAEKPGRLECDSSHREDPGGRDGEPLSRSAESAE